MTDYKLELIRFCAKNLVSHALGNVKYSSDIVKQYDFIMTEGTPELKALILEIYKNRGLDIKNRDLEL